uniref:Uncharacterized protein n=1 Tax=Arundo donax TaxID=35708 RepID=A0A0A9BKZ3_ARUDO
MNWANNQVGGFPSYSRDSASI